MAPDLMRFWPLIASACSLAFIAGCVDHEPVVVNVVVYEAPKASALKTSEVVRTYTLDRTYYDFETKPGGTFFEKVKNMMNVVEPGKVHVFFVNGKRLSIRMTSGNIREYDKLVPEMLCTTEITGQECYPITD
jgi:hypothetical protein